MKLVTVAGPPSSGKTSVIIKTISALGLPEGKVGVVKFDSLTSFDHIRYGENKIPVQTGFAGKICPDHFFVSNIEDAVSWGKRKGLSLMITESAGLCNRCSPYIKGILSVCVIDNLSGVNTPRKIGPMLKYADIVVVTKGDIVSQAEREVFAFNIKEVNSQAKIIFINGITGQGTFILAKHFGEATDINTLKDRTLRFTMPAAICSYCTGETRIGDYYQMGMLKRMEFDE
ncbi:Ni2+-binding GTPase involved in maturation of urease and hydrogenase [Methanomicrobium sp. W14]|uniref:GTP-binding protein n=1 Tax=Methanomicrobium sp. W14 TaxID=2817839 RepID=UPI001AE6BE2A|nr:GTP-binding protein [Methanomicrobium sp. W14]MBP2134041.1 Ni2+-binding GTPase involved in maturation of urease and hydrogenase [Methanomicrobium sp. W14]